MAGIFSQGGSAGHRYAGWLSEVEAKNFQFGGKVFNGSPSAIYVGSNLVWGSDWLTVAAQQAILGAFGQRDDWAVINATNAYLNQLAASGQAGKDKATALAGFINEDPMMVCSLGLSVEVVTMPIRWLNKGNRNNYFDLGIILNGASTGVRVGYRLKSTNLGSDVSIFGARAGYGSRDYSINFGAWGFGTFYIGYNSSHSEPSVPRDSARHTVKINKGLVEVDSWSKNYGVANFTTPGTAWFFANRNGDEHPVSPYCLMDKCEMWENDIVSHTFLPMIKDGNVELMDVETGTLATRYGTFTIEYSLPDGTPWPPPPHNPTIEAHQ